MSIDQNYEQCGPGFLTGLDACEAVLGVQVKYLSDIEKAGENLQLAREAKLEQSNALGALYPRVEGQEFPVEANPNFIIKILSDGSALFNDAQNLKPENRFEFATANQFMSTMTFMLRRTKAAGLDLPIYQAALNASRAASESFRASALSDESQALIPEAPEEEGWEAVQPESPDYLTNRDMVNAEDTVPDEDRAMEFEDPDPGEYPV